MPDPGGITLLHFIAGRALRRMRETGKAQTCLAARDIDARGARRSAAVGATSWIVSLAPGWHIIAACKPSCAASFTGPA